MKSCSLNAVYKYEYLIKDEHGNLMTLCKDVFNAAYAKLPQSNDDVVSREEHNNEV